MAKRPRLKESIDSVPLLSQTSKSGQEKFEISKSSVKRLLKNINDLEEKQSKLEKEYKDKICKIKSDFDKEFKERELALTKKHQEEIEAKNAKIKKLKGKIESAKDFMLFL